MWKCEDVEMDCAAKFGFTQRHKEKSRHKDLAVKFGAKLFGTLCNRGFADLRGFRGFSN